MKKEEIPLKKIIALLLVVLTVAGILTGCGDKAASGGDQSLNKVTDAKKMILGLDDSFPPMGYRDENNNIVGFDIDVATEVCARLGVELVLQPISWDAKEQELNSGNIDCIWNGMSVSPERAEAMNLSDPYMNNRMVLVVLGDTSYNTLKDLAGQSVGVQTGSTAQSILEEEAEAADFYTSLKETIGYKDNVTAFMDLEAGGIAAVFLDEVVANHFIAEQGKDYRVLEEGIADEQYAIGFRKNDQALRDKVQETLKAMKADGKLAEISEKWFGKDVTIVK